MIEIKDELAHQIAMKTGYFTVAVTDELTLNYQPTSLAPENISKRFNSEREYSLEYAFRALMDFWAGIEK